MTDDDFYKYIDKLARNRTIERIIYNLHPENEDYQDLQELAQDLYITLIEQKDKTIPIIESGDRNVDYYLTRLVKNNLFSVTSRYYYQYKKYKEPLNYGYDWATENNENDKDYLNHYE